ncbi:DUF2510 domain-containing protein [Microbacterium sp. APC 3901]|uniref:DUF2510 domain-containing protein n=1 Tax=Microbacterium sp. APC 3901 TaxID=3035192 RepID=UPI0025B5F2CF|nr:DUF2510 domain-containing protein [Microbacterium sp. APC 3901]MDN3443768.1 DUF2510 domain-containing protein [Microbacterium sp. APC 3901]
MTTPAGWYDDGSGRQRWWDGTQWTEHFAPIVESAEPAAAEHTGGSAGDHATSTGSESAESADHAASSAFPESAADAETAASIESVAAVESQSWNAPAPSDSDAAAQAPVEAPADAVADHQPESSWSASETPVEAPGNAPEPEFTAPGGATPSDGTVPPYAGGVPSYPGAAAPAQSQEYAAAPGYPGAAAPSYPGNAAYAPAGQQYGAPTGYPAAYGATAPAAPSGPSILGLVGLGLAALGTILSCIPVIFWLGWLLLGVGFIVSLISLFLKGKKWPGISGLILSVVGAIIAVVMFFVIVFATVSEAVRDLPTAPPSSDSDTGTGSEDEGTGTEGDGTGTPEVVEGELGSPVPITQMTATSEVTIHSATWATSDGSSIPSTNGGYVILDVTFTGVSGTSYLSAFNFGIETAEGVEGTYDYYVDGIVAEELEPGDTVDGKITFDVAQSESYDVIFTDELLQEVTRITVVPSAG